MKRDPAQQRVAIANKARALARSGEHTEAASIVAALSFEDGFDAAVRLLADPMFRTQLDRLCFMACERNERRSAGRIPRTGKTPPGAMRYSPIRLASL